MTDIGRGVDIYDVRGYGDRDVAGNANCLGNSDREGRRRDHAGCPPWFSGSPDFVL